MAGIQTFSYRISTGFMGEEFFFTRGRLRSHRYTKILAADFDAFRPKLDAAMAEELALIADKHEADAGVEFADEDLDALLDAVATVSLIEAQHDRNALPYARYFGSQRPSDLKRPILGAGQEEAAAKAKAEAERTQQLAELSAAKKAAAELAARIAELEASLGSTP